MRSNTIVQALGRHMRSSKRSFAFKALLVLCLCANSQAATAQDGSVTLLGISCDWSYLDSQGKAVTSEVFSWKVTERGASRRVIGQEASFWLQGQTLRATMTLYLDDDKLIMDTKLWTVVGGLFVSSKQLSFAHTLDLKKPTQWTVSNHALSIPTPDARVKIVGAVARCSSNTDVEK